MAELQQNTGTHGQMRGVRRGKKLSTRVDLTPMVDLGFLLITFFIFTTSMSTPKSMKLYLPAGDVASTLIGKSSVLTILPLAGNRVFYYHGDLETALINNLYGITTFSASAGIGDIILQKQKAMAPGKKADLMLIIKPARDARYQNVVAALDEVLINNVQHYAVADIDPAENMALLRLGIQ